MRSVDSDPPAEEPSGRSGPPDWVRILLLVAFTGAVLLGMSWLMHDAPPPDRPTPTTVTDAAAVAQPTRAPAPNPTRQPTLAPTPRATATTVPTAVPTVSPALAATLATDWWDWSTDQIKSEQKGEAVASVDRYWVTLKTTWWDLDPQHLADAVTQPRLDTLTSIILQRRQEGRAQKVDVQRTELLVRYVDDNQAVVYESYINRSIAVDFVTRTPLEVPPTEELQSSYLLGNIDGTYKVAQVVSHDTPPSDH